MAYFWALAGTLQGLLRPGIPYDFPEFRFIDFTIFHGGIIASVLFLTFGMKMRPYPASMPRVIAWSLVYMAVAGLVDWQLGVDYGFLRSKPIYPSLYDLMPAWPYYLPVVDRFGLAIDLDLLRAVLYRRSRSRLAQINCANKKAGGIASGLLKIPFCVALRKRRRPPPPETRIQKRRS